MREKMMTKLTQMIWHLCAQTELGRKRRRHAVMRFVFFFESAAVQRRRELVAILFSVGADGTHPASRAVVWCRSS